MMSKIKLTEHRGGHRCYFCGTSSWSVKYEVEVSAPEIFVEGTAKVYCCNLCAALHNDELTDKKIVDATYVSVWDGGYEIATHCKVNLDTKEIFDVEIYQGNVECYEALTDEYIIVSGQKHKVAPLWEHKGTDYYWYS